MILELEIKYKTRLDASKLELENHTKGLRAELNNLNDRLNETSVNPLDALVEFDKHSFSKKIIGISYNSNTKTKLDEQLIDVWQSNNSPLLDNNHNYDVALSFAGEDRNYAEHLASLLKQSGYKVFYDKYEQSSIWGKNLYTHLSEIYSKKARYCVMFLSQYYAKKLWTNHERMSAQERSFKESKEYILPIRLDDTKIPGILDFTGYIDLRYTSIEEVFGLLKKKLNDH